MSVLRNLGKKIRITTETTQPKGLGKRGFVKARDAVKSKILTIRKTVIKTSDRWRKDQKPFRCRVKELQREILNVCSHVFGEHKRCSDCKREEIKEDGGKGEPNIVPDLKAHGLFQKVWHAVEYISCFSDSLLFNMTNNSAEAINSIICKTGGGKRSNNGLRERNRHSRSIMKARRRQSLLLSRNWRNIDN